MQRPSTPEVNAENETNARLTYNDGTRKQNWTAAPAVNEIPRGKCTENVDDRINSGHKNSVTAKPAGFFENSSYDQTVRGTQQSSVNYSRA